MFATFQRSLFYQRLAAPKVLNFPPWAPRMSYQRHEQHRHVMQLGRSVAA